MAKINHLSRLAAPKTWPIKRKGIKWIAKPVPGPHNLELAMPLSIYLREILKLAKITRNIKKILNSGEIKVNNKTTRELNFPVGIFDVISIEKIDKHYRVLVDQNGKLRLSEITKDETKFIPLKIVQKNIIKKGKTQICFNNGWNILADGTFKIGDCVLFDLENKKIKSHLKQEPGVSVYILSGEHANQIAKLNKIKVEGLLRKKKLAVLSRDSEIFETAADKIFIVGKEEPEISVK